MGEEDWPEDVPRSKGTRDFHGLRLGEIVTTDGPRVIVCADCGAPVNDGVVFHLKPETYAAVYEGEELYLERHVGVACGCAAKRGLLAEAELLHEGKAVRQACVDADDPVDVPLLEAVVAASKILYGQPQPFRTVIFHGTDPCNHVRLRTVVVPDD